MVAEAAFQDQVWRQRLGSLEQTAALRVVRCWADPVVARRRLASRGLRAAHADATIEEDYFERFAPLDMAAPTLDVDTTDGYRPSLQDIVAFVDRR